MPSPNRKVIKIYVTEDEYQQICAKAAQARLSHSSYVRAISLGIEPKSKVDQEAILALLRVNQDLARLGNLFKLAVDQAALDVNERGLIVSINQMKEEVMKQVRTLYDTKAN
jgi:hypothetical protein